MEAVEAAPVRTGGLVGEPHVRVSRSLILATALVGCTLFAALLSVTSARWPGPFGRAVAEPSPAPGARPVGIATARASSALPPRSATGPQRAVDGDPATAWNEAAGGDGTGEWLELELAEPAMVTRLLVWNGWQRNAAVFAENNRVEMLRIRAGGRAYTVRLLDRQGPLAVNLPAPVGPGAFGCRCAACMRASVMTTPRSARCG